MKRIDLAFAGCCVLALGVALLAFADGLYSVQGAGVTVGGTTGESMSYRANTMMADPMDNDGSSESYGTVVEIPETVIDVPTAVEQEQEPVPSYRFSLSDNYPNPFNPRTTIAFEVSRPTAVSLEIFDLSGRRVRVLIDGDVYSAGPHEVVWRGRDNTGRQMASGSYFYRLEAGTYRETKRMILIK